MAIATQSATPSRDDFAKMLEESFTQGSPQEGAVVKGTVVGIEKDLAVIDVGAKTEGRVALREFAAPGRQADIKVGDTVEVYLERIENALGEAVLSREKARREESWVRLEVSFTKRIFDPVKKNLDFIADLQVVLAAGAVEFTQRHPPLGLQADIDDSHVLFNGNNRALDDGAFLQVAAGKGFVKHRGEIVAGRMIGSCSRRRHVFSRSRSAGVGLKGVARIQCQRSATFDDRLAQKSCENGPACACMSDTEKSGSRGLTKPGAGIPPMTAGI